MSASFSHKLPGEHVYDGSLFFGFSPPDTLDAVKDFEVRDDDIFIVTYPKAGTTWMQELVWLVMNDGNIEAAKQKPVYFRSAFLEFKDEILNEIGIELANPMPSPRVLKSHLQVKWMPRQIHQKNCKIVVMFRNPKDLCVSYYHFYKSSSSLGNFTGDWPEFLRMFLCGHVDHGSWFDFTRRGGNMRNNYNVKIVFFEFFLRSLSKPPPKYIGFAFLNKSLSLDVVDRITRHCSFESMRRNPMTNHDDVYSINADISPLLRKGTVGDWKNYFTVNQNEDFDRIYQERLGDIDIPFVYQL
ncbi:sulfotransferase 1C2-like [Gigantopelta aegis]|uniref:sulfotransferase 1C2-like n=1 Tax=Gigantopelta aegis TaxID=1735272 RepID=UPI001B88D65B|nr:sulfotransferase 1C2-like [Gigantopelta aegis]